MATQRCGTLQEALAIGDVVVSSSGGREGGA